MPGLVVVLLTLATGCGSSSSIESSDEAPSIVGVTTVESEPAAPTTATPPTTSSSSATTEATSADPPATTDPIATVAPVVTAPPVTVPPTSAPAPLPAPSTSLPPPTGPSDGVAVVHAGAGSAYPWLPVGYWDGVGWLELNLDEEFEPLPVPVPAVPTVAVASIELAGGPLTGLGYAPTAGEVCVDGRVGPVIDLGVELPDTDLGYGYRAVAVSADWDIQPRPVAAVGLDADVYQAVGERLVPDAPAAVPSRGDVVQVLRADLDGDGAEEVLFTFEDLTGDDHGFGAAGNFSLVVARHPQADGTVVDQVLFEHVVPEAFDFPQPGRAYVAAVADLNGDGVMEVAVRSYGWESAWITIFELVDGGLDVVMAGGCGS